MTAPATTPLIDPAAADALLAEYGLPERAPVEQLRGITRVAATVCNVPHAVVNLLSGCFQHQVGEIGFDGGSSDLGDSMCSRAVREPGLRYLPDASLEPAFAANPWVDGRMAAVRLYASAPMNLPDGRVLGTLCVFSDRPGYLSEAQLDALRDLAGQAVALFDHTRLADEARRTAEETHQLAEELRLSEQQHRLIFDAAPVGMIEADAEGHILVANAALGQLLGYDPAELAGVRLPDLTHPDERAEQDELLMRATYGHLDAWDSDRRMLRRDGRIVDTVAAKRVVRSADGEIHRMLVSVLDMSERAAARRAQESANQALEQTNAALHTAIGALDEARREAEQHEARMADARDEALAATRAKSAFLAAVSHEIRTPLNGMLGMLELLLLHDLDDAQRERAGIANTSGKTLLALLNDILDLSRGEAHDTPLRPQPMDPARLARDVTDSVRGSAHLKGLEVALDVAGQVPAAVRADLDRLRQMLLNLLGNAVKFTDAGRVGLALDVPQTGWLRFRVRDTGPGIAPEEVGRLFQAFEQGAAGAAKGGTGLGLALCRQLAELMGGSIAVDSRPGDTTFTLLLPLPATEPARLEPPAGESMPGESMPDEPMPDEPMPDEPMPDEPMPDGSMPDEPVDVAGAHPDGALHVLLVDDDRINRMVGAAMLTKLGARVTLAEDGRQAVDAARATAFDLILMDRNMPEMDGLAATRALRADPVTALVPIAALTGAGDDARQECLDAGMDHYLTKPISLGVLEDLLRQVREHALSGA